MNRSFSLCCILALISSLLICSCAKKKDDSIKIGIAMVLSGPNAMLGTPTTNGALVAIDEWNARGGVLGRKIIAIRRDDENKPDKAVIVAQELVDSGVCGVIGHFNSGCTLPASAVYARNHIVEITPASSNPKITEQGFTQLFRLAGRDDQQGKTGAEFIRNKLKVTKLAILHDKTAYGQGLAEEVQKDFISMGGEVVVFSGVSNTELDFRGNITQIKDSGAQAVYWGGLYSQTGTLIVQLRQSGVVLPFITGHGSFAKSMIDTAGAYATDVYLTFAWDWKNLPSARTFIQNYHQKYGEEGPYSANGYDAANMLLESIKIVGSTDQAKIADTMHVKAFHGALGTLLFDDKGDLPQVNFAVFTIKDGSFIPLPQ